ncbi:MAG: HAMP domain-containing histidine kinase [Rhodothermales bacterium]|nr:HAMP domain-containing histidine kinase [Rhodothermales bacterium]
MIALVQTSISSLWMHLAMHFGGTEFLQQSVDAEVWFPAVAIAACIILFGLIIIYILRIGSGIQKPQNSTSKENFSEFFNQAEVGIGVIDEEGFFVLCNKSLQDLTGYTATQLTTIGFSSLFADRSDYVEPSKVAGMLDRFGESHQVFLRQRTGALIRVRFLVLPSPPAIRENAEVLLIEEASADHGGGGEELSESDSLQNAKDSFLASLNHDLKTPLTVILGSASMLASEKAYSPELVEAILESGQRLLNEIDGLLLAKSHRPDAAEFLPINVHRIVSEVVADYEGRAENNNISIDTRLDNIHGSLNHIALQRLIHLLLDITIDRTKSGSIHLSLEHDSASFMMSITPGVVSTDGKILPVEVDRRVILAAELAHHLSARLTTTSDAGDFGFSLVVPYKEQALVPVSRSIGKAA